MTTFFDYGPFDLEVARKQASLELPPNELAKPLLERLALPRLSELWSRLEQLPFDHIYPGYLTHPVRVAVAFADEGYDAFDDAALALCHNVIEAGFADEVEPFLGSAGLEAVERLTIDRAREHDPSYLAGFYHSLATDRRLLLLKGFDKLDNMLWWPCFEVDNHDATVVTDYLYPLLREVHPRLASYVRRLTDYARSPGVRSRFAPAG